jgi:tetratricopeptide (TPR) repeat protein
MNWQDQNERQWLQIEFVLQGETMSDVMWITCDEYQHRHRLLIQFQDRFPHHQHTIGKVDQFQGGSLPAYLLNVFRSQGGGAMTNKPQIFHVSGLERYLSYADDKGRGGFFEALNFERPLFYQDLPFVLVFWTHSHTLIQTHRLAADFWEWLSKKFHFEGPKDQLGPEAELGSLLDGGYWVMPDLDVVEQLQNRNARLLAQLEKAKRPEDSVSLWIGLADNHFKLRDFSESIRYRLLVLAHLSDRSSEFRAKQITELIRARIFLGQKSAALGQIDQAKKQFELAISETPENGFRRELAYGLQSLGDLERRLGNVDSARVKYEEAIGNLKSEQDFHGLANVLKSLGDLEFRLGNVNSARSQYEEAIGYYKTEGANLGLANALKSLADLELGLGNIDSARALYEEAIGHYKTEGDHLGHANALKNLGQLYSRLGNLDDARRLYQEAISHYRSEHTNLGLANALQSLGDLELRLDNLESARSLYEEAVRHFKAEQNQLGLANALKGLADLECRGGNLESARLLYGEAIGYYKAERNDRGLGNAKLGIGLMNYESGLADSAFPLLSEAAKLFEKIQDPMGVAQSLALIASIDNDAGRIDARDKAYSKALTAAQTSHAPGVIAFVQDIGKKWGANS